MSTPRSISVFLPGILPTSYLSPNRGERKEGRVPVIISEHKRQMRGDVALGLLAEMRVRDVETPIDPCQINLTLRWYKRASDGYYRPTDWGNAAYSLKAAIDGIIDAGLIVDDDYRHVVRGSCAVERCDSSVEEGLLVEVVEL